MAGYADNKGQNKYFILFLFNIVRDIKFKILIVIVMLMTLDVQNYAVSQSCW